MLLGFGRGYSRRTGFLMLGVGAVGVASCSRPSTFSPPSISASGAASEAMSLYDTDGDGLLSADELQKVASLKESIDTLDTNDDGKVSRDEIVARIEAWQATQVGVMSLRCDVKLDGQPLAGADVEFEPESFMGDAILAAGGQTDEYGIAYPVIPKDKRPTADMPGGLQTGFYRIRVSKKVDGKELVPARYNTNTTLGHQIAMDDTLLMRAQKLPLNLTSK